MQKHRPKATKLVSVGLQNSLGLFEKSKLETHCFKAVTRCRKLGISEKTGIIDTLVKNLKRKKKLEKS